MSAAVSPPVGVSPMPPVSLPGDPKGPPPSRPMPPAGAKPSGTRPMSAVARSEPPAYMQEAQDQPQRPLSAGSTQRLECLSKDVFSVRQDQETLHRVVDQLSLQMEELKKENQSLMEKLHKRNSE
mmetsp:Transcript_42514/g.66301  ORF Transcript_42514/g.66301 Transcript_42514/m.66301 type:complete len:125 (+) Transcript_42514:3-377(+)